MSALVLYHDTYSCTRGACTGPAGAQAPELVLLHGWGLHSVVWDPVVPALLEHFQVTVIDLPGMGRSPLPNGEYSAERLVAQLLRVAPARATWMGWSLGGQIATLLAAQHPERVSGLCLVASNPSFIQRADWSEAMAPELLGRFQTFFEEDADGTLIRFLSLQCQGSVRMREDIRFLQEILHLQGLPAPRALREGLRLLAELDVRSALAALTQPVQAILGAADHLVPAGVAAALAALKPDLAVSALPGSGHVPFLAQPEDFLQAFLTFAAQHGLSH